jgi:hypothetical protein
MTNPGPTPSERIENDSIILEYLTEAGPRITGLWVKGSNTNLMGTAPSLNLETPYGTFAGRGGHRLWHSPEAFPRSYIPDNTGLTVERAAGKVTLTGLVEPLTGIQKAITIELDGQDPQVTLTHTLTNHSVWPVELAAWAITMMPMGGVAILPDQLPGTVQESLLPDRRWALWPYDDLHDPRVEFGNDLILIRGDPRDTAFKIGYANKVGWLAYYLPGVLFVKRFSPKPDLPYPDFGCNAECYVKTDFLELETLGPLTHLQPGASTVHVESWRLYRDTNIAPTLAEIRQAIHGLKL